MAKTKLDLTQDEDRHIDERLRNATIIWLGSVRPAGRPHLVAVWFLWDGDTILIFSQPDTQKVRNLGQNLNVTLALDDTRGGAEVITIEGQAELLPNGSMDTIPPAYADKYADRLARMRLTPQAMAQSYSQPIRITPTRFTGW
jgi:PPOX class probable F420-dependent enzyme